MILLERIRPTFHNHRHSEQAGFTAGRRSTTEHIFGTRRIIEKSKAFNKSTYIAFIDFKAAFDSVSRDSLGKIHQICGVPQELYVLVRQLYTDTRSAVRLASSLPDEFTIETGVTQGCVIVPDLFNCAIDQLMRRLLSRCSLGIQLVEYKFTDLDHADDIAIIAPSQDLTRFNKIATQGAPQMAADKEANSLSRVYSYYSKFNLCLFYM